MTTLLSSRDADFATRFEAIVATRRRGQTNSSCIRQTAEIIDRVERQGEKAVREYAQRWDGLMPKDPLRLQNSAIAEAAQRVAPKELRALRLANTRIRAFHKRQKLASYALHEPSGLRLDARVQALDAVALYVPGGRHPYPSSLLMTAIPARIAGVQRIVVTTPQTRRTLPPILGAALQMLDIDEVYSIGGAQAIATLALGCESIAPVDLIAGPGNAWVVEAKRQLFGRIGIDSLAGPSEVLILADNSAEPAWLAADLLAQAEHDTQAMAMLIADDANLIRATIEETKRQTALLPQDSRAHESWQRGGLCLLTEDLAKDAPTLVKRLAPEHAQVIARGARKIAEKLTCTGSIFIGAHTPVALGDYVAGTNHVLPTATTARFASCLSVETFTRRTTLIEATPQALNSLAPHASLLARAEGFEAHARSLEIRNRNATENS